MTRRITSINPAAPSGNPTYITAFTVQNNGAAVSLTIAAVAYPRLVVAFGTSYTQNWTDPTGPTLVATLAGPKITTCRAYLFAAGQSGTITFGGGWSRLTALLYSDAASIRYLGRSANDVWYTGQTKTSVDGTFAAGEQGICVSSGDLASIAIASRSGLCTTQVQNGSYFDCARGQSSSAQTTNSSLTLGAVSAQAMAMGFYAVWK